MFYNIAPGCFEIIVYHKRIFKFYSELTIHDSRFTIPFYHSVLKLFTGLTTAAFIAWKLTVINAINITNKAADANSHQLMVIRYG